MMGLSPHGRGNPGDDGLVVQADGSIPARAGEPSPPRRAPTPPGVYPRTGGGTVMIRSVMSSLLGLSPHGRGNRGPCRLTRARPGSIPARAGEPPSPTGRPPSSRVYPRTGGGTSPHVCRRPSEHGLSPHGRGNLLAPPAEGLRAGSIPARAGEPPTRAGYRGTAGVYPRTGGGTPSSEGGISVMWGLSPHGRGNPTSGPVPRMELARFPSTRISTNFVGFRPASVM